MIVDYQSAWLPPSALDRLIGRTVPPRAERRDDGYTLELVPGVAMPFTDRYFDLDRQFRDADRGGVDVMVSAPVSLGEVLHLPAGEAAELLDDLNATVAAAQRDHHDRFVGLAMLPMQDADTAVAVLNRAHRLGLSGVCMLPSIDGAPLGSEETLPIFQHLDELGMPVFLHPQVRSDAHPKATSLRAQASIGWMCDTTMAAFTLIDSGILDRCPNLVVVHPHLGGVFPWIHARVTRTWPRPGQPPMLDYLRNRFYTDSAGATPGALGLAMDVYGADKMLFATDYPFIAIDTARSYITAEDATTIYDNRLPGLRLPT